VERKLATALFADLVDSTGLGEQDPERTRAVLERFYDAMAGEIEAAGGTVEKFAGDAVMAVFGAPAAQEDHAERALHAALSMQRRLSETFAETLRLRIGVNTGEVVVGEPRVGSSFVTGDAVNVANRLEQAAQPGEVLAGERTVAAARGAFEFGARRGVDAKGKADPIACRSVLRALSLMRPRGLVALPGAFVGRETELDLLTATYRRSVELETPHLATILGDAGVGKTRLVRELWQWLADQDPCPRLRTGRCLPYGHAAYWAMGEVLKEEFDIRESDPQESVARRLGDRAVLGLALGREASPESHPAAVREELYDAFVAFFEHLARDTPAIVLVEDLHWAEEPLLDLLERVVRDVRGPLTVIATSRPELLDARPGWSSGSRNASSIWLEPLAERDARRMVEELPPRLREVVVTRAEGNPFFVEELVSALVDRGALVRGAGGWQLDDDSSWENVPDTVQALLAARIDLLDDDAKATLQAAAVIGRAFWCRPLESLIGREPSLLPLESRDFVRRRSGSSMEGDVEYAFRHALTREVAYASLPKARRAQLHAGFAEWLEETGGGRDEHAQLLAHHFAEAARPEDADLAWTGQGETLARLRGKALHWLKRAGALAISRYELEDGIALLERAAALEPSTDGLARIWRDIGRAQALRYDGPAFRSAMERSLALTEDTAERAATLAELAFQTSFRAGMFREPPDGASVEGWIDTALELAQTGSAGRARALAARVFWRNEGMVDEALEAQAIAERIGDPAALSTAARAVGYASLNDGRFADALEWTKRSVDLIDRVFDPEAAIEAHEQMVLACIGLGRVEDARRFARVHDELVRPLTTHHRVHGVSLLLEVADILGEWDSVLDLRVRTEETIAANVETPCGRHLRDFYIQAIAHEIAGRSREAQRFEQLAEELAHDLEGRDYSTLRAHLALARGDPRRALEAIRDPTTLEFHTWWWFRLPAVIVYLDVQAMTGARDEVERVAELVLAAGNVMLHPFAERALGRVRGDTDLIRRAAERFRAMGLAARSQETAALL
jgi:class 3 adenylate cyclase/tetratricopeptide (TPR) repeat protein